MATDKPVQLITDRVIIGHDEGNDPELEPLFANNFELMQVNTDIFLDIGVIAPQHLLEAVQAHAASGGQNDVTVKFAVLQRVAMSGGTFVALYQKVKALYDELATRERVNASPATKAQ